MIKRKTYLDRVMAFADADLIKILVGIRRAGKSSILTGVENALLRGRHVAKNNIIKINFEDLDYLDISTKSDFLKLVRPFVGDRTEKKYFLLDEVQRIDGWDEVVNGLRVAGADVYLTGSNSKLLSKELSTYLTGRFINTQVFPLNFSEYLDFRRASGAELKTLSEEFKAFMERGGFPALHTSERSLSECDEYIRDVYSTIIFRDLVERHKIRNTELLTRIVKYIFDNIGNLFSAKSVADFLKSEQRTLSIETIYNYLKWLEEVFVIFRVPRTDLRGKSILKMQEKFYLGDIGFLYAVNGRNRSYSSGVLENIVFCDLVSKGYDVKIGKNGDKEIDFVAERQGEKLYLQICETLKGESTREREFSAFEGINDNFPKYVLVGDKSSIPASKNGISAVYLPDFLLSLR
ncbi:ATP-binding protein [Candidatus Saccharibacteria bacterium]|nr:ATP-binding protein [Candidatus Saccharibacteria bacterium]